MKLIYKSRYVSWDNRFGIWYWWVNNIRLLMKLIYKISYVNWGNRIGNIWLLKICCIKLWYIDCLFKQ